MNANVETVTMPRDKADELVSLLEILRLSLHSHAIGALTITPEKADELRHRIERFERTA